MAGVKNKGIREALQYVADHPTTDVDMVEQPVWELIGRVLFEVANNPDAKVRGSLARATKAQRLISDRLVGTRRPGTHPAQRRNNELAFTDLTAGAIDR